MYSLKYCHAFQKIYKEFDLLQVRIACVILKNEAFVVDVNENVWHILNNRPKKIEELCGQRIKQFSYCYSTVGDVLGYYAVVLLENGDIYGWGNDDYKLISDNKEDDFYKLRKKEFKEHPKFKILSNQIKIDRLEAGQRHCMAVTKSNELILWGDNSFGQLGSASVEDTKPYNVFEVEKINKIESPKIYLPQTRKETYYVEEIINEENIQQRNSVYCCFQNIFCMLSLCYCFGFCYKDSFCERVDIISKIVRKPMERTVPATPLLVPPRVKFNILKQVTENLDDGHIIKQIACGSYHSLVLLTSGDLYAFGSNSSGQLGIIPETSRKEPTIILKQIEQVVATGLHTLALTFNKRLFAMGDNSYAQLGSIKPSSTSIPIEINFQQIKFVKISTINGLTMGRTKENIIYCWGYWGAESGKLESDINKKEVANEENDEKVSQSTSSDETNSTKRGAKKKTDTSSSNAVIGEPRRVYAKTFEEIVARRFSITHYTIRGDDFDEPVNKKPNLIDKDAVSVLKEDAEIEADNLVSRVTSNNMEIDILRARVEVVEKRPTVQIDHIAGDKITSKIIGGTVVVKGSQTNN